MGDPQGSILALFLDLPRLVNGIQHKIILSVVDISLLFKVKIQQWLYDDVINAISNS